MNQTKIQEFIVSEIRVNHLAGLKKGQTIAARDERSKFKWAAFLCERGYTGQEAEIIVKDAYDMAVLEMDEWRNRNARSSGRTTGSAS